MRPPDIRARAGEQTGYTIVEIVVAALCIAIVIGAVSSLFVTGNDTSLASQRQAALVALADRQIEAVREAVKASGFSALAMSAAPAAGSGQTLPYNANVHVDPNDFVTAKGSCGGAGAEFSIEWNYDDVAEGASTGSEPPFTGCDTGTEPLIVQAGGIVTPAQTVAAGNDTATIDTYVTQTNVGCNAALGSGSCTGDARRVVVAVVPHKHGVYDQGPNSPLYVSTIFTNPVPSNAPNSSIGITLGARIG